MGTLILTKEARIYSGAKISSLLNKCWWENWTATCKRMNEIRTLPYAIYKDKLKMD